MTAVGGLLRLPCPCGKTLVVREGLAGKRVRCKTCERALRVPLPADVQCTRCGFEFPDAEPTCPGCGWNAAKGVLVCAECRGPITLNHVSVFGMTQGGVLAAAAGAAWFFLGALGALGAISAVIGIACLLVGLSLRWECGMCGKPPPARALVGPERWTVRRNRLKYVAAGCALGAVALGVAWIFVTVARSTVERSVPQMAPKLEEEDTDDLVEMLASRDAAQRALAAEALGKQGEKAKGAVPALFAALDDAEWDVQRAARDALDAIGELPFERLERVLAHPSKTLRTWGITRIQRHGARAIPALRPLLDDPEREVRRLAYAVLEDLGVDPGRRE